MKRTIREQIYLNEELELAVQENRPADFKQLIAQGADIHFRSPSSKLGLLHRAVTYSSKPETVQALIELGADVNAQDASGHTALGKLASLSGSNLDVARVLIEAGGDVNIPETYCSYTPLHTAARNGRDDLVRIFIDAGADLTLQDDEGRTAEQAMQQAPFVPVESTQKAQNVFDGRRADKQAEALETVTPQVAALPTIDIPNLSDALERLRNQPAQAQQVSRTRRL